MAPTPPLKKTNSPAGVLPRVTEVSVFKDGHVLVREEARLAPDRDGTVTLDRLPTPVEGSYLPYVATPGVQLEGVVAGEVEAKGSRELHSLVELLKANPGVRVRVNLAGGGVEEGILEGLVDTPDVSTMRQGPDGAMMRDRPNVLLLKVPDGRRLVPLARVTSATLIGPVRRKLATTERQGRLRMLLSRPAPPRVTVGAQYLQKGIRWLPGYRLDLNGQGQAQAQMRATVVNELADLRDADLRLVIGVPRIFNENQVDPLSLGRAAPSLTPRFQPNAIGNFGGFGGGGLGGFGGAPRCAPDDAGEGGEGSHEDLFYLPARRISLKKGETMLLPLGEAQLDYHDVYTVDIPYQPEEDADRARGLTQQQKRELAEQLYAIRAKHQLRLANHSTQPLTTGPATIFREGRLLAHSLILFTPVSGSSLCLLGDAPEIEVSQVDQEDRREEIVPPADRKNESAYAHLLFEGRVKLVNQAGRAVDVELVRNVPGNVLSAPGEGVTIERLDRPEDTGPAARTARPWVNRRTGSGRVTWKVTLKPGETRELTYQWEVFREN